MVWCLEFTCRCICWQLLTGVHVYKDTCGGRHLYVFAGVIAWWGEAVPSGEHNTDKHEGGGDASYQVGANVGGCDIR